MKTRHLLATVACALAVTCAFAADVSSGNLWPKPGSRIFNGWDGNGEFHVIDSDSGASNNSFCYQMSRSQAAACSGKRLHLSVDVKQTFATSRSCVGIGLHAEGGGASAGASVGTDTTGATDWKTLHVAIEVPAQTTTIRIFVHCALGFGEKGEASFRNFMLTTNPALARKMTPMAPLSTFPEMQYVFKEATNDTPEKAEFRRGYREQPPTKEDGMLARRPVIKDGTFYFADGPCYFAGPWIYGNTFVDWDSIKGRPPHLGITHIAYEKPPSKEVWDALGINSHQISAACAQAGQVVHGFEIDPKGYPTWHYGDWKLRRQRMADYYHRFEDVPMVVDFAFGFNSCFPKEDRALLNQRQAAWHDFVPFCGEIPGGRAYYRDYFLGGTRTAMRYHANVFLYELFNESSYDCYCRPNRLAFARQMKRRYGTIEKANEQWGTAFLDFDELALQTKLEQYAGVWYDWCVFSTERYVDLLRFGQKTVRSVDQRERVYFTEQASGSPPMRRSMDYRRIADALDVLTIEGGWRFGFKTEYNAKNEMEAVVATCGSQQFFNCDFYRAVAKDVKPIADNELYCARYENGLRVPSPAADFITCFWMELMHGVSASYLYSWDKRHWEANTPEKAYNNVKNPSYKSHSMLNPYNVKPEDLDAFGRFQKELAPYKAKLMPCPRTKPATVAVFYSKPSEIHYDRFPRFDKSESPWHPPRHTETVDWYEKILHAHYPVKVVFEEDLKNLGPEVKALICAGVPCATPESVADIHAFENRGGLVLASSNSFVRTQYMKRTPEHKSAFTRVADGNAALAELAAAKVPKYVDILEADGKGAILKADAQICDRGDDFKLVMIVNLGDAVTRRVRLCLHGLLGEGPWMLRNVVTGEVIPSGQKKFFFFNRDSWTREELERGVFINLPSQERVILVLTRD